MCSSNDEHLRKSHFHPEEWITLAQAAKLVDIGYEGLKKACQRGKMACIKKGGRWWIEQNELMAYIERTNPGRPPKGDS